MDSIQNTKAAIPSAPVLLAAVVLTLYFVSNSLASQVRLPTDLPWVGSKGRGPFSGFIAAIRCLRRPCENLKEGYDKYLRHGRSYIFPKVDGGSEIVIPNDRIRWLLDFADHEVSVDEAHFDMLAGDYAFTHPDLLRHPFHCDVVHRTVSRKLHLLIPSVWDEAKYQVDLAFGHDTEGWREVTVLSTVTSIVAAISNRMFFGLPLCRETKFQDLVMRFATGIMLVIMVVQLFPRFLRPVVGRLAAIPNHICVWQSKKYTLPLIKKRLADIEEAERNPASPAAAMIPEEYLTWQIRLAKQQGATREYNPDWIAKRLMPLEFAALHTTSFTIANVLLDLVGSDSKFGYIKAIREEVERVYGENQGVWSKNALARMIRTDSAIRESMRVSCFGIRGVQRKVLAKAGLRGEEGWTAPYGSIVSTDVYTRHHDPDIYPEPYFYDAFRFSREREHVDEKQSSEQYVKLQNLSLISTSDSFLTFGHGRHACPGRFFINIELKLMLAYLVMNYDFEPLKERPINTMMGEVVLPPSTATIRYKRRARIITDGPEV